jgi:predicted nucleic acid-binding protein
VRFWDTSALVPLLVDQPETANVSGLVREDGELIVWWSTSVECASALSRLRREEVIDVAGETQALSLLDSLMAVWTEVLPSEDVRMRARRLLRVHALRAADALQLAAALVWADAPAGQVFVTYDERLALAARLEGFTVLPL